MTRATLLRATYDHEHLKRMTGVSLIRDQKPAEGA
jgi:hypothetical protein